jgi:general stress protein 26
MPDKNDVLEMMARAEAVYLATSDGVSPRIRALVNLRRPDCHAERSHFCAEAGFTSYFSTSRASGKVRDVLSNPMVSVYYADPAETHGIELRGPAEVVDDEAIRQRLWQDEWRI